MKLEVDTHAATAMAISVTAKLSTVERCGERWLAERMYGLTVITSENTA
jgi:hypothetical protein